MNQEMMEVPLVEENASDSNGIEEDENSDEAKRSSRYLYEVLSSILLNNLEYFRDTASTNESIKERFVLAFTRLLEHLQNIEPRIERINRIAHEYDIDEDTPGNGYRSYVSILDSFILTAMKVCRTICLKKDSTFFRAEHYCKEVEALESVLNCLRRGLDHLEKILANNEKGDLFSPDAKLTAEELLDVFGALDQSGFYGRCLGFYFSDSVRRALFAAAVTMASFSEIYMKKGGSFFHAAASFISGSKYALNPEARAQQIIQVAQNASIDFIKAFWSLNETYLVKDVPNLFRRPTPVIYEEITVPAEPIMLPRQDGMSTVEIPVPTSHKPAAPIRCLLLSYLWREGQPGTNLSAKAKQQQVPLPPSPGLVIHCHGGGFVAQSPEAHDVYLLEWAKDVNAPILSIDYSHAPEAPFPRALEEILLVYAWVLKNLEKLGTTGDKICVTGDSAGGNLTLSLALKTIEYGIRKPDAVYCQYTPLILDMVPSPSRLLCVMDPLLPLGFMLRCLDAYGGLDQIQDDDYEICEDEIDSKRKPHGLKTLLSIDLLKEFRQLEDAGNESLSFSPEFAANGNLNHRMTRATKNDPAMDIITDGMKSKKYLTEFLESYLLHAPHLSSEPSLLKRVDRDEHVIFEVPSDLFFTFTQKCRTLTKSYWSKLTDMIAENSLYNISLRILGSHNAGEDFLKHQTQTPWFHQSKRMLAKKFEKIKLASYNPFMSPLLASDEVLKQLPPTYFLSLNYDPTLDDSVMFIKRLKKLGCQVHVDILDKLPHGFLNFIAFSHDAYDACKVTITRLRQALHFQP